MISILSLSLLGFFLGMRHATDPDHVVAVVAIVSRARTLRAAAPIGVMWGIGHTFTILVVGGAIVLFGIVIPPRLGLTMELSVAVMLVLLGGLNLAALAREARAVAQREAHAPSEHEHDAALTPLDRRLGHLRAYQLVRPWEGR
jgi:high-affinity nickel-transport protein